MWTLKSVLVVVTAALALSSCGSDGNKVQCGGKTCASNERCCGPAACGICVPQGSEIACRISCNDASGPTCGGNVCAPGTVCCGPAACGYCVPANSGAYCPPQCPDVRPADRAADRRRE